MSEADKGIVQKWNDAIWSQGSMNAVEELIAADFIHHATGNMEIRGIEEFKNLVSAFRGAYPDAHFTTEDMTAEADRVFYRWVFRGTQQTEWLGVPPNGKLVSFSGISEIRLAGGKIAEHWAQYDYPGWLKQVE